MRRVRVQLSEWQIAVAVLVVFAAGTGFGFVARVSWLHALGVAAVIAVMLFISVVCAMSWGEAADRRRAYIEREFALLEREAERRR